MSSVMLPSVVERYFAAKSSADSEAVLDTFASNATVWDNGEDLTLRGIDEIREWMTGKVAGYKLTSEVVSADFSGDEGTVAVVVSGDFPGSPYEFAYRFSLAGDKIQGLTIDPVGSLAK